MNKNNTGIEENIKSSQIGKLYTITINNCEFLE
jgi:hypothetical protein